MLLSLPSLLTSLSSLSPSQAHDKSHLCAPMSHCAHVASSTTIQEEGSLHLELLRAWGFPCLPAPWNCPAPAFIFLQVLGRSAPEVVCSCPASGTSFYSHHILIAEAHWPPFYRPSSVPVLDKSGSLKETQLHSLKHITQYHASST